MKILVTGSSGLVGTALGSALVRKGHTVCRLVRPQSVRHEASGGFDVAWNPLTGELGGAAVGADAVVNLAGAPIAGGRWTAERKEILRASRVDTTHALVKALAQMNARPRVLISASAIGVYGNRGEEWLTEESAPGTEFLSGLARDWEAEALTAEALGIRVVLARFGIILAKQGGALPPMMVPFKFGLGGKIGSGQQWMSWVTLQDAVGSVQFAIENASARGAINIVAPQAVRNAEFTEELARAIHRPALFPVPRFALRLALGEMADALLLSSQRVAPQELEKLGYHFTSIELSAALAQAIT
jgi:uncharacterized protein (TIGR01777 family)